MSFTTFTPLCISGTNSGVFAPFGTVTFGASLCLDEIEGGIEFLVSKSSSTGGVGFGGVVSLPFHFLLMMHFPCLVPDGPSLSFPTRLLELGCTPGLVCILMGVVCSRI